MAENEPTRQACSSAFISCSSATPYRREPWFARRDAEAYGVVLDAHGKIAWGRSNIGGDLIVAVLTNRSPTPASRDYPAVCRRAGIHPLRKTHATPPF